MYRAAQAPEIAATPLNRIFLRASTRLETKPGSPKNHLSVVVNNFDPRPLDLASVGCNFDPSDHTSYGDTLLHVYPDWSDASISASHDVDQSAGRSYLRLTTADNLGFSHEGYARFVSEYLNECGGKESPDPRKFIMIRALCAVHKPTMSLSLKGEVILPSLSLSFVPVVPLRVVSTPLASSLHADTFATSNRTGYLTLDQYRNVVPLLDSDAYASKCPLIGIWVYRAASIRDPYVWAACLRFLYNDSIADRVSVAPLTFMVLYFDHTNNSHCFLEVTANLSGPMLSHFEFGGDIMLAGPSEPITFRSKVITDREANRRFQAAQGIDTDDRMPLEHPPYTNSVAAANANVGPSMGVASEGEINHNNTARSPEDGNSWFAKYDPTSSTFIASAESSIVNSPIKPAGRPTCSQDLVAETDRYLVRKQELADLLVPEEDVRTYIRNLQQQKPAQTNTSETESKYDSSDDASRKAKVKKVPLRDHKSTGPVKVTNIPKTKGRKKSRTRVSKKKKASHSETSSAATSALSTPSQSPQSPAWRNLSHSSHRHGGARDRAAKSQAIPQPHPYPAKDSRAPSCQCEDCPSNSSFPPYSRAYPGEVALAASFPPVASPHSFASAYPHSGRAANYHQPWHPSASLSTTITPTEAAKRWADQLLKQQKAQFELSLHQQLTELKETLLLHSLALQSPTKSFTSPTKSILGSPSADRCKSTSSRAIILLPTTTDDQYQQQDNHPRSPPLTSADLSAPSTSVHSPHITRKSPFSAQKRSSSTKKGSRSQHVGDSNAELRRALFAEESKTETVTVDERETAATRKPTSVELETTKDCFSNEQQSEQLNSVKETHDEMHEPRAEDVPPVVNPCSRKAQSKPSPQLELELEGIQENFNASNRSSASLSDSDTPSNSFSASTSSVPSLASSISSVSSVQSQGRVSSHIALSATRTGSGFSGLDALSSSARKEHGKDALVESAQTDPSEDLMLVVPLIDSENYSTTWETKKLQGEASETPLPNESQGKDWMNNRFEDSFISSFELGGATGIPHIEYDPYYITSEDDEERTEELIAQKYLQQLNLTN